MDSNVAADTLSLQSRLAGRQKTCRLLRAAFSSYAAACTIAAVTKKSLGTCKGVARSSTDTCVAFANGRWRGRCKAGNEAYSQIWSAQRWEYRAKKYGPKGQIMEKRKYRERNGRQSRTEVRNKTRNLFSLCCWRKHKVWERTEQPHRKVTMKARANLKDLLKWSQCNIISFAKKVIKLSEHLNLLTNILVRRQLSYWK